MAMAVRQSNTDGIAQCGMSRATLKATADATIGQLLTPYCPSGRQGKSKQNDELKIY
jgi:hypothetical protein